MRLKSFESDKKKRNLPWDTCTYLFLQTINKAKPSVKKDTKKSYRLVGLIFIKNQNFFGTLLTPSVSIRKFKTIEDFKNIIIHRKNFFTMLGLS